MRVLPPAVARGRRRLAGELALDEQDVLVLVLGQPRIVFEVPITAPLESSAWTATYAAGLGATSVVSKPVRVAVVTGARLDAEAPASSRQVAVRVSPLQLTYTVSFPAELLATAFGAPPGAPVHGKR